LSNFWTSNLSLHSTFEHTLYFITRFKPSSSSIDSTHIYIDVHKPWKLQSTSYWVYSHFLLSMVDFTSGFTSALLWEDAMQFGWKYEVSYNPRTWPFGFYNKFGFIVMELCH
jgi:hypothetical protein